MERADIAILGTGPAGISAAITATVRNKNVRLFGNANLSGKIRTAHQILNYPGLPRISGQELGERYEAHLRDMGIEIVEKRINSVIPMGDYFGLISGSESFEATTVILATGVVLGKPFLGEREFLGKGVSYCATCDAGLYRGKTVAVLGYDEEAQREADFLAEIVEKVYYFPVKGQEVHTCEDVEVIRQIPREILGEDRVRALKTNEECHDVDGVFILRDSITPEQLVMGLESADGHVEVNRAMETKIPGLFACGDITGKPYQYVKAAGEGNVAALSAAAYLDELARR